MSKSVAIIGAGFGGLSAGYYLAHAGHRVTLFEQNAKPGGLAVGYQKKNWDWTLEHHYHHWFTNDDAVLRLAREIDHPVLTRRPKTSVYVRSAIHQLDSPRHLLTFPLLSLYDRIRMAGVLAALKFNPYWKPLEAFGAEKTLRSMMGACAYDLLWKPQLHNKFGSYASNISLAWFWARIVKRTPSLAYPEGGYLRFAQHIVRAIENSGGTCAFNTSVSRITPRSSDVLVNRKKFDAVLVTVPNKLFSHMTPSLPKIYHHKLQNFKGIGAVNLVLRMKKPFFSDGTYWLSICEPDAPVMAIVEHTNFMDSNHYDEEHLVYVANYADQESDRYTMSDTKRLALYDPILKKIKPDYKNDVIGIDVFKAPFAQPIIPPHYSKRVLPIKTPAPHTYLANMQQVYPWDRGTNYAVELGKHAADAILELTPS